MQLSGAGDADFYSHVAELSAAAAVVVQGVVAEADDADYWFHASRDGNREKHYR